jgi:hypothetical protein
MSEWKQIKRLESQDSRWRMTVVLSPNNLFRFTEDEQVHDDGYTYWSQCYMSGVYASADEAERAARSELPWLRDRKSN